jgi:thiol-disulfide isomerase/thioredoxin
MIQLIPAALVLSASFLVAEPPAAQPAPPTVQVDPAAYESAKWPAHNTDLYANDFQGKKLEVTLGQEQWLTEKKDLTGQVLVLDFWATWCGPCIAAEPKLTKIQKDFAGKLSVIGISGQGETADVVQKHMGNKKPHYAHLHDDEQRVFKPFESRGIPLVVVVSTDGVVRWMGNPHDKKFEAAVKAVVEVDPLIKAKSAG